MARLNRCEPLPRTCAKASPAQCCITSSWKRNGAVSALKFGDGLNGCFWAGSPALCRLWIHLLRTVRRLRERSEQRLHDTGALIALRKRDSSDRDRAVAADSSCFPARSPEVIVPSGEARHANYFIEFCNQPRIAQVSSERRWCCRGDAHEPIFVRCSNRDRVVHEWK